MKSIFVSHVYEDNNYLNKMINWQERKLLGEFRITHETEDKRHQGNEAIRKHLLNKIKGAAIILILIGDNTHNHDWIRIEVELANSFHKKIICVRIPQTAGSRPKILNKYKEITFNPNQILKELK